MFNSNNYDTLLKMIEDCINLKVQVPEGCSSMHLEWFDEICKMRKRKVKKNYMKIKAKKTKKK